MAKPVVNEHQPSITEWFAAIGEAAASEAFRAEDNRKAERLEVLYQAIGLPYERPEKFAARELWDRSPAFAKILHERGDELCAIRLVPRREGVPKIRNRGLTIRDCYETWFRKLDINPDDYDAYLCPHCDQLEWSAIFVVSKQAIFGEIIRGMASQLTHGETTSPLYQFRFDFQTWQWSSNDPAAAQLAQAMIAKLRVSDAAVRNKLAADLKARFTNEYLTGYFETTVWPGEKLFFIDYNRVLPRHIPTPVPFVTSTTGELKGAPAFAGTAKGPVVIVNEENLAAVDFPAGSVLVCDNTDVRYLLLMRKAAAIVTNRGGILSHAAIIARELKIPCIIGTKTATRTLRSGDLVEVDARKGTVRKL